MFSVRNGILALALALVVLAPAAHAQAATMDEMLTQIKALMTQIETLKAQLNTVRTEVKSVLKDGLAEGMTDADIKKIQEVLATDPAIYPEGKVTGYFGPLTKEALKRFQMRHELSASGVIDPETRDLLEEYLHEGFGDKIPPGLLRAPGIMKKVEMRYELGCEKHGHGMGPLCKKLKSQNDDDGDDEDDDDDNGTSTPTTTVDFNVTITIVDGTTTVSFTVGSTSHEVIVHSTTRTAVLAAVADELDTTVSNLDSDLVDEVKSDLAKALKNTTSLKTTAQNAIDAADTAIDDAQDAIDAATGTTTEAEALLAKAQAKLDAAENAFDDAQYAYAADLAKRAKNYADDAVDAL